MVLQARLLMFAMLAAVLCGTGCMSQSPHRPPKRSVAFSMSAKGAAAYQPGVKPQENESHFWNGGLKARPSISNTNNGPGLQPSTTFRTQTCGDATGWYETAPLALNSHLPGENTQGEGKLVSSQSLSPHATNREAKHHQNIPTVQPHWWQKLNPVFWWRNADDPQPPDWYRPGEKHRQVKWHWRNFIHNFTFYVIGIADKKFERAGRYPEDVFHPQQGWNWAVCRYKFLRLPFISFKGKGCQFYLGWRERGNFGARLTFHREKKKPAENLAVNAPQKPAE